MTIPRYDVTVERPGSEIARYERVIGFKMENNDLFVWFEEYRIQTRHYLAVDTTVVVRRVT